MAVKRGASGGDKVTVLTSAVPRWYWAVFTIPAVYLIAVVTNAIVGDVVRLGINLVVTLGWTIIGYRLVRKKVELHVDGIRYIEGFSKRWLPWNDVQSLRVDPPGGRRIPRLSMTSGDYVSLPELRPAMRELLEEAYARSRRKAAD